MSNHRFEQFQLSLEKKVVSLFMNVSFGASGAPTLVTASNGRPYNRGIQSITRNSAGNYTIVFQPVSGSGIDTYQRLLACHYTPLNATAAAAPLFRVEADNSASGNLVVQFASTAGAATDPASGEVALIEIKLSNSSL